MLEEQIRFKNQLLSWKHPCNGIKFETQKKKECVWCHNLLNQISDASYQGVTNLLKKIVHTCRGLQPDCFKLLLRLLILFSWLRLLKSWRLLIRSPICCWHGCTRWLCPPTRLCWRIRGTVVHGATTGVAAVVACASDYYWLLIVGCISGNSCQESRVFTDWKRDIELQHVSEKLQHNVWTQFRTNPHAWTIMNPALSNYNIILEKCAIITCKCAKYLMHCEIISELNSGIKHKNIITNFLVTLWWE